MDTQIAKFQDKPMEILSIDGRKCMTAETIGKALGYANPRDNIIGIFNRGRDEFEEGIDYLRTQIAIAGQRRNVIVFCQTGVNLIGFSSKRPLAKEFRKWAKHVLAQATVAERPLDDRPVKVNRIEYVGLLREKIKLLEELRFKDHKLYVSNLAKKFSYSRPLSERYQLCTQLYSCGISIQEIATELHLSMESVYAQLKKANMVRGGE